MGSPLKSASRLLFNSNIVSPKSPNLLLAVQHSHNYPQVRKDRKKNENWGTKNIGCMLSNVPQIKLTKPEQNSEWVEINSPNKRNLLKYGLNKYDVLHLLGKGSYGAVIKGKYKGNNVAVKVVKLNQSLGQFNECNALHLIHENIIRTVDIIVSANYGLVFMDYHENSKNLHVILENDSDLSKLTLIKFCKDITTGINYCHENGVLHLDIKPKNILLCDGICKICDFGNSVRTSDVKAVNTYKGTVPYTAPEILKGKVPTTKSDVYSLGILFCQTMSRASPYELTDNEVIVYKVVKFKLRPSLKLLSKMKEFSKLCQICWDDDPDERPTAAEVLNILNSLI